VNLSAIRAALLPQSMHMRRGLLAVFGAVAIIVGLLSMHTLSGNAPSHDPVAGIAEMDHHLAQTGAVSVSQTASDNCTSGCEPMHAMALMACLLVLMTIAMIVVAMAPAALWFAPQGRMWIQPATRISTGSPSPPSLEELSISRT
jgi:hypothetical protein